jgi:hypothetical protein
MRTRIKLSTVAGFAALLAFSSWSALAQSGNPAPVTSSSPHDEDVLYLAAGGPGPEGPVGPIAFVSFEGGFEGKTVTGVPFTATVSVQNSQVLADGNQIQNTSTGTLARDSQGRTRRDLTLPAIGPVATAGKSAPHVSMINDPVGKVHYMLDPDKKEAHQMSGHRHKGGGHGGPAGAAVLAGSRGEEADQANVTSNSLGTKTINGVSATGTLATRTIPAGAIGNQKPIVITTERWYSAELQTVVLTKTSDPRMGEFVRQLSNIQRQEPDASLFQVPADYTIVKGPARRILHNQPTGE